MIFLIKITFFSIMNLACFVVWKGNWCEFGKADTKYNFGGKKIFTGYSSFLSTRTVILSPIYGEKECEGFFYHRDIIIMR